MLQEIKIKLYVVFALIDLSMLHFYPHSLDFPNSTPIVSNKFQFHSSTTTESSLFHVFLLFLSFFLLNLQTCYNLSHKPLIKSGNKIKRRLFDG